MKKVIVLALLVMVILSACGSPAPAPTAAPAQPVAPAATEPPAPTAVPPTIAPTEAPAATEAPTEAPAATEPPATDYFTEDFNAAPANWTNWYFPAGTNEIVTNPQDGVTIEAKDGLLAFKVTEGKTGAVPIYDGHEYTDVRVDARFVNDGRRSNYSTLMCRFSEDGWYEFNINNGGDWWTNVATAQGGGNFKWSTIAYGGSQAISTDVNEIGLKCDGDMITGYINGTELKGVKNSTLTSGKVGFQAGAGDVVPVKISLDWLKVSDPNPKTSVVLGSTTLQLPQMWRGIISFPDGSTKLELYFDEASGMALKGRVAYTSYGTVNAMEGEYFQEFDKAQEAKWSQFDDFDKGIQSGVWLKFHETKVLQGRGDVTGVYYAHISEDGKSMTGLFFLNDDPSAKSQYSFEVTLMP